MKLILFQTTTSVLVLLGFNASAQWTNPSPYTMEANHAYNIKINAGAVLINADKYRLGVYSTGSTSPYGTWYGLYNDQNERIAVYGNQSGGAHYYYGDGAISISPDNYVSVNHDSKINLNTPELNFNGTNFNIGSGNVIGDKYQIKYVNTGSSYPYAKWSAFYNEGDEIIAGFGGQMGSAGYENNHFRYANGAIKVFPNSIRYDADSMDYFSSNVFRGTLVTSESFGLQNHNGEDIAVYDSGSPANYRYADGKISISPSYGASFSFNPLNYLSMSSEGVSLIGSNIKLTTTTHLDIVAPKVSVTGNLLINKTTQTNTNYKVDVDGAMRASEVVVNITGADYVFENDYHLIPIQEVAAFIKENGHLPNVDSADEMENDGVSLGGMNSMLLEKIEELTLYLIEQNREIEQLKKDMKGRN